MREGTSWKEQSVYVKLYRTMGDMTYEAKSKEAYHLCDKCVKKLFNFKKPKDQEMRKEHIFVHKF